MVNSLTFHLSALYALMVKVDAKYVPVATPTDLCFKHVALFALFGSFKWMRLIFSLPSTDSFSLSAPCIDEHSVTTCAYL